ncbi:response regulator transcription factor [Zhouia spongiae]|uniref:Response regulator transcription factor n=1 Tax=Zhouia spongiae TaxID=2202721 RepID=A0ABY3YI92_9FLAO|nr:response regulator transcription factor [Zhouia spongiae]UNY97251.1 response regulator transcription factor [Zhouia spongiae]
MSDRRISIVLIDDHSIVVEGLKSLLNTSDMVNVIGEFTTGSEALHFLEDVYADIVFLDINLPDINGIDLCRKIRTLLPDTKILALSNHTERNIILQMLNNGANGYVLKNVSREELLKAVEVVRKGEIYFSSEINEIIAKPNRFELYGIPRLTKREKQILVMIAKGETTQSIASSLNVSPLTIETHRRNLHFKFKVKNVAELIMAANQCQLL